MEERRKKSEKHKRAEYNIAFPSIHYSFVSSLSLLHSWSYLIPPSSSFYPILATVTYYILITPFLLSFLVLVFALHPLFDWPPSSPFFVFLTSILLRFILVSFLFLLGIMAVEIESKKKLFIAWFLISSCSVCLSLYLCSGRWRWIGLDWIVSISASWTLFLYPIRPILFSPVHSPPLLRTTLI